MYKVNKAGVPIPHGSNTKPRFKSGGSNTTMDAKYKGACCDGTKKWGEGNKSECMAGGKHNGITYKTGEKYFVCGNCRLPLPVPAEVTALLVSKAATAKEKRKQREIEKAVAAAMAENGEEW